MVMMNDSAVQAAGAAQPQGKGQASAGLVVGAWLVRGHQVLLGYPCPFQPVQASDLVVAEGRQQGADGRERGRSQLNRHGAHPSS